MINNIKKLDLALCHIKSEDDRLLTELAEDWNTQIYDTNQGFIVVLDLSEHAIQFELNYSHEYSDELNDIIYYCENNKVNMIEFHCDGPVYESEFKIFNW